MPGCEPFFVTYIIRGILYSHAIREFYRLCFHCPVKELYDDLRKEMHTVMNQNTALIKKQNRDEIALQKYTMISPLLDENIDPAAARELRSKLAEQNGLSERTLRRYVNAYQKKGFEGLKPSERVRYKKEVMPDNYEEILQEAIQLRREVPRRSVEQIIFILESEGKVAPGSLKRPTLQRHLYQAGFGSTHMDIYQDARRIIRV